MSAHGWIKLHRELLDKSIWKTSTPEQKVILITLLMMANHEEKNWEWAGEKYTLKPGQFVTSIPKIVETCGEGVTDRKVRTALEKFKKLEFLTDKATVKGRLITIENWGKYQSNQNLATDTLTDKRQTDDRLMTDCLTGNKKFKNVKNDNKERERAQARAHARTREETLPWGRKQNVLLTIEEHEDLLNHFENAGKLIDQVSNYLANATRIYPDHDALIWKIAEEDGWPKKKRAHRPAAEEYEIYRDEDGNEYARLKGVE